MFLNQRCTPISHLLFEDYKTFKMDENDQETLTKTTTQPANSTRKRRKASKYIGYGKATYFCIYAVLGSFLPYRNVFLTSIGLSASQTGYITGVRTIISVLFGPVWGMVADYTGHKKRVFLLLAITTVLLLCPLPWVAHLFLGDVVAPADVQNVSQINHNAQFLHNSSHTNSTTGPEKPSLHNKAFLVMMGILFTSAMFDSPLLGYYDAIVMDNISTGTKKTTFGIQRMFGSIGFGVGNLLGGIASDHYHPVGLSGYSGAFLAMIPPGILMIPAGLASINQAKRVYVTEKKEKDEKLTKLLFDTCTKLPNAIFLFSTFVVGLGNAVNYGYTLLLMEDYMCKSKSIMALTLVVSAMSEILMFPFANKVMDWLGGIIPTLILGVFSYFVRFVAISYVTNPWLVLPIQALHCLSFALFWCAAIEQVHVITPPKISATMFSLLNSIDGALGQLVGNLLSGVLYEHFGGKIFFRGASSVFLVWSVVMLLFYYTPACCCRSQTGYEKIPEEEKEESMKDPA